MHHREVFPHSHSATAVLSPNSFNTYTSCVDNIHASQFFEKVTITHLNDGYWSQRIRPLKDDLNIVSAPLQQFSTATNYPDLRNKIYHSLPSKLELHDPSFEPQLRAPITFVISLGLKMASPPSPTVVNAEITKLAINDDAPRTRATTPETVASNRAPSAVPSTASTGNPVIPYHPQSFSRTNIVKLTEMTPPTLRPRIVMEPPAPVNPAEAFLRR
ncbi:hypothetical protein KEM48_001964 [Puccinia striiformis f. sp. tritici PST-130]|nr:hypothetical protein KEM48_001964 [Puccinia striiformis f. sp. tritici PST-130]